MPRFRFSIKFRIPRARAIALRNIQFRSERFARLQDKFRAEKTAAETRIARHRAQFMFVSSESAQRKERFARRLETFGANKNIAHVK